MERGARGSHPCSLKTPTGGGCHSAGARGTHPQGRFDGGELEEDASPLLGADGAQLLRRHLQQLVAQQHPEAPHRAGDRQTDGEGLGGPGSARGVTPPTGGHALGTQGTAHIREKPLSFSQAVTSAGEEPMCRLGGLTWEGGQRERGWGGDPRTPLRVLLVWRRHGGDPPGSSCPRAPAAPGCCWGRSPCAPCCSAPATTSSAGPAPRAGGDNAAAPPTPHTGGVPL